MASVSFQSLRTFSVELVAIFRSPERSSIYAPNRRHLLGIGRDQEALAALCSINGAAPDDPIVQEALEELAVALREENEVL